MSAVPSLFRDLLPRLNELSGSLRRGKLFERAIAATGLPLERPAMSVLGILHLEDEPLRIGEIATRMNVVGPHVTRQVQGLESRGLVRRVADPDDQRARLIELTPRGTAATERYVAVIEGWFAEAMSGWSAEDRQVLDRLLTRLVEDLTARLSELD
ncbi:MarR family transcriptional regulator [Amycolatopsis rubida]|uniref:DNA-binding transcriptional regulator, MarR family n=1 Tax=Amycolatopsis rubida TaxID=112413 RepID=A0A1I5L8M9_9PSEU|nr:MULTISPECIES: MarR family transcriptional regulator [Amycolatopsis]MYW89533.1 MarR family transcriptional regulator [Amycolatopsis rubida]NEC54510.1 MarR family transcriptional regulator [Amycolatopsis rubida]OAP25277.1 Transcriptional regulator SlyA [Amycolatopsis sp. M39]SFO93553.1 DNA-binding transcriptional regulator, MarR family [Amycolatopsis rubida]